MVTKAQNQRAPVMGVTAIASARGYNHLTFSGVQPPDHISSRGCMAISPSQGYNPPITSARGYNPPSHLHGADESTMTSAGGYKSRLHALTNPLCLRHGTSPKGTAKQGASHTAMASARHLLTSARDITFSQTLLAAILDLAVRPG